MTATTTRGYPYPEDADFLADTAAAVQALAEAVDADIEASAIQHVAAGNRLDAAVPQTSNPAGLRIVAGKQDVTFGSSVGSLAFPAGAFPNGVLGLVVTTYAGTANPTILNGAAVSKTAATLFNAAGSGVITVGYIAIGY